MFEQEEQIVIPLPNDDDFLKKYSLFLDALKPPKSYFLELLENLIVYHPMATRHNSSERNGELTRQLGNFCIDNHQYRFTDCRGGFAFDTIRIIPDGTIIDRKDWNDEYNTTTYVPVVPLIVIELMSDTDTLTEAKKKMKIYKDNGVEESILIVPTTQDVYIFRPGSQLKKKKKKFLYF